MINNKNQKQEIASSKKKIDKENKWISPAIMNDIIAIETFLLFHKCSLFFKYSRTSLSRTRLFQITAYLEVKIWSLVLKWNSDNR